MRSREDKRALWTAVLVWALMCGLLWVSCDQCAEVRAESPYSPGDTLTVKMTARDSLGVAVSPDTVRLFVYRYGALVESSKTYPGTIASLPGSPRTLFVNYVIPTTWSNSYALDFLAMGTGDGLFDEWVTVPANVRVNAYMDSIGAVATAWTAVALTEDVTPDSIRAVGRAWDVRGGHLDTLDLALVAAQITEDLTPDSIRAVGRAWDVRGGHIDSADVALVAVELTEEITATVDSVDWVGVVARVDTTTFTFRSDSVTVLDEVLAIDDLSDAAIDSIVAGVLAGTAGAGSAEIDTCATGASALGVYLNDTPVDLARVWIHSATTLRLTGSGRNVLGETWAVNGYWRLHYFPEGDYPDTIYVSAWTGGTWPLRGVRIIVADDSEVCP